MGSYRFLNIAIGVAVCVLWISYGQAQKDKPEIKRASQCFKSRGIPKVKFNCRNNEMIKIRKAFHGIAYNRDNPVMLEEDGACSKGAYGVSPNCTFCDGDCIDDSMNLVYDWSTCMGNRTCERTVMQSYMPSCPHRNKFSDYLQVEYQCIQRPTVIDICTSVQKWMTEGYIMSPNYPHHYPTNKDCLCQIQGDWNSRIVLSFYDLLLETKKGRCRADWLMLRQKAQKHRHCGAIMTGTKNVTSETNTISLQFHSDENDNKTQNFQYFTRSLKGFWLYFRAEPDSSLQVTCRSLSQNDAEVKEIYVDDADYNEVVSTRSSKDSANGEDNVTPEMDKPDKKVPGKEYGDRTQENEVRKPTIKKKNRKKTETGRENSVDNQKGRNSAGIIDSNISLSLSIISSIFILIANGIY